jgi:small subunit ribosomal protein S13
MARIAGIELPKEKKILFALPYLYGVGNTLAKKVVVQAKIDPDKRVKNLTEEEVGRLQKVVESLLVEGDLRRLVVQNIKRLEEVGTYRGLRHRRGLPVRGQRTRSNSRTKRGKRMTVGAVKKEVLMKQQAAEKTKATAAKSK